MKKTLALILAIVMVCAFATTAFAADDIVGTVNGTNSTANGNYLDGATTFDNNGSSANVAIKATQGNVQHRYAVDITYEDMSFDIATGNMVWDVTAFKYIAVDAGDQNAAPTDTSFNVTITNRSDVAVKYTANISKNFDDGLSVTTTSAGATIDSAVATKAAVSNTFAVEIDATTSWAAVRDFYAAKFAANDSDVITDGEGNTSIEVATLTVTVSLANN